MAQNIRYITIRDNGIYYYERRVPKEIIEVRELFETHFGGKRLFRKSLRTRRQSDAMERGIEVDRWFEAKKRLISGGGTGGPMTSTLAKRQVTDELLKKISLEARSRTARPWDQIAKFAEHGAPWDEELARMAQQRELDAPDLVNILKGRQFSADPRMPNISDDARRLIRDERLDAPEGSDAWIQVARAIRSGIIAGHADIDLILSGGTPELPTSAKRNSSVPAISEAVQDYVSQRTPNRTVREVQGALKSFIKIVGDLPLDEIQRADFIRFCEAEGKRVVGGKSRGSIERPVSPATLQKKVRLLHSVLERAIKRDRFNGPNPAAKIDAAQFTSPVPKATMPDKRPLDVHEINLILRYPWFTGCKSPTRIHAPGDHRLFSMHFWAPLLALYSGCRAGELGGLMVSEVMLDHQYPHLVIRDNAYRTTKGSYRRKVPLLDVLISLGFGEFVEKIASEGHERLFPDWEPPRVRGDAGAPAWSNGSMIRSFNRTVIRTSLRAILNPNARQEVTFHGFRGAFKTLLGLREYGIPENYKHEVIGHSKSNLDKRYVGEIPLEETYPAIRACNYSGIRLPSAP